MFMDEPSLSVTDKLRNQFGRVRERIRKMFPFASGVLAALLALFLYNFLFPGSKPLTQKEVSTVVASAMASATPRSPFSVQVYQVIQPSLLLIESELQGENGGVNTGLGSGVIIDNFGDILTSLHVVANAETSGHFRRWYAIPGANRLFATGKRYRGTAGGNHARTFCSGDPWERGLITSGG
jgi:S1-C subfamily serine protease